jgi:hypothetical protein
MTLLLRVIKANNLLSSITPLIFVTGRRFRRSGGTVLNAVDGTFNRYRRCGHCQHKKILKCAEGVERQATLFATYEIVISSISMPMISTIPRFRMRLPNAEINLSPRGQGVSSPRLSNLGHCCEVVAVPPCPPILTELELDLPLIRLALARLPVHNSQTGYICF